jgi:hypothetical protein
VFWEHGPAGIGSFLLRWHLGNQNEEFEVEKNNMELKLIVNLNWKRR